MNIQKLYAPHLLEHHDISRMDTSELLKETGIVDYTRAGFYTLLPIGMRIFNSLQNILRKSALKNGFQEISLPKLQPTEYLRNSRRLNAYTSNIYRLAPEFGDLCLSRTNEEIINALVKNNLFKRHIPLSLFQFGEVFSNNTPSGGLVSSSEFSVFEAYSFHLDKDSASEMVGSFKRLVKDLCERTNLNLIYVESDSSDYGNFLSRTNKGQHKIFVCEENHYTEYNKKRESCIVCGKKVKVKKGLGVAMFKIFDDSFAKRLNLKFQNEINERISPFLTTYGIGLSRLLYSIAEQNRDKEGLIWPDSISPFDIYLIPQYPDNPEILVRLTQIEEKMESAGIKFLTDDRKNARVGSKIKTSRFVGIPRTILITKNSLKIQDRNSLSQRESSLEQILEKNERR